MLSMAAWLGALLIILAATVTAITAAEQARGAETRHGASPARTLPVAVDPCTIGACW
jgi:hypothetical protein